jgi:hypothetical protein
VNARLQPCRVIVIPDHGGIEVYEVQLPRGDGGFGGLWQLMEGEPEEVAFPGRRDVIAFRREDGMRSDLPRNNRATRLLQTTLQVGEWIAGDLVLCGQDPATEQIIDLPAEMTADTITVVTTREEA